MDRYTRLYFSLAFVNTAAATILLFGDELALAACAITCATLYALLGRPVKA